MRHMLLIINFKILFNIFISDIYVGIEVGHS